MSQTNTINPYSEIGGYMSGGLGAISTAAPVTEADLVNAVVTYIGTTFYQGTPSTQVSIELKSIARNAINSYRSNLVMSGNAMYNGNQAAFINLLIGPGMTANTAPASFDDTVADIENNIGISDLTVNEQTALFLATTVGAGASAYWAGQLSLPTTYWNTKIGSNAGKSYMNSLLWNVAAMNGALAAYGASSAGLVEPTTAMVTNQMVSALIGALTITAGKVIFNWIPKITKPLSLNLNRISPLSNNTNAAMPTVGPIANTILRTMSQIAPCCFDDSSRYEATGKEACTSCYNCAVK